MTTNDTDWAEHRYYKEDPWPDIEPALLNSLDIRRYVDSGCLIETGSFNPKRMKPASYEMRFLGELYNWQEVDGRLQKQSRRISAGECATLQKNSISYLWTEERLLLPEYIGARFNLRIRDVHKGILLGTGPLIDPGFGGRILIPLHNLTDNDYEFEGGEGIIWVEFTKVSKNPYWLPHSADTARPPELVEFPNWKVIHSADGYLNKAGVGGGVQSAFKRILERTQKRALDAETVSNDAIEKVDVLERRFRNWGFGGLFVGALGVAALLVSAYQLTFPIVEKVYVQSQRINELRKDLDLMEAQSKAPVVPVQSVDGPDVRAEEEAPEAVKPVDESEIAGEPEISTKSGTAQ